MKQSNIYLAFLIMLIVMPACNDDDAITEDPIETPEGYSLLWSDEFDDPSINTAKWQYEIGDGTDYGLPVGWGNNERQIYTENADNSGIENDGELSALFIRALSDGNGGFTSAKMTTKNFFSMRFGRIDIKAKMPKGQGIWPAIWMLGTNIDEIDWPGCGEIDIVEMLGHEPNKVYSTLHYTDLDNRHGEIQGIYELSSGTFHDTYHNFSLDWTPDNLTFSVDGVEVRQVPIEDDMKEFLRSFYLVLNVAVGGNWPGFPDNTTSFPQTLSIDYIRVFEKNNFNAPLAPMLDIDEETIGQNIEPSLAQHAIKDDFTDLGNATVVVFGGGGEPVVGLSEMAIDGDSSLVFDFPGGTWGGAYIELEIPQDLSGYTYLNFSLKMPAALTDAEIKLESPPTNSPVFLTNYIGTDIGGSFQEYSIPLTDFSGLDLTQVLIPFAIWNPKDSNDDFVTGAILIDNINFSN